MSQWLKELCHQELVLHVWFNKKHGMYNPVCGMVHIKDPLLLIGKSSPCNGSSGFPLSLYEWSFTICLTSHNCKYIVLSVLLNKTFRSFCLFQLIYFLLISAALYSVTDFWKDIVQHNPGPNKRSQILICDLYL